MTRDAVARFTPADPVLTSCALVSTFFFFPLTLYCFAEKAHAAYILGYLQAENCLDMAHDFPAMPDDAASTPKMTLFESPWLLWYQLVEPITALLALPTFAG